MYCVTMGMREIAANARNLLGFSNTNGSMPYQTILGILWSFASSLFLMSAIAMAHLSSVSTRCSAAARYRRTTGERSRWAIDRNLANADADGARSSQSSWIAQARM